MRTFALTKLADKGAVVALPVAEAPVRYITCRRLISVLSMLAPVRPAERSSAWSKGRAFRATAGAECCRIDLEDG